MAIDEQYWRSIISGERESLGGIVLRLLLRAASWPYAAIAAARRWMYASRWKRLHAASAPAISVGNITTGGTGKTPMVAWVVRHLQEMGRTPAILTRGYKSVEGASDEATMLEQMTATPVIVNSDRVAGAAAAVEKGADVLVMDDGFQNLRLRRDLDIVTIDATCPFGYDAVLPRGMLREPVTALGAADVFVLTRCDQANRDEIDAIHERLGELAPMAPVVESVMKPVSLRSLDGRTEPAESLAGQKVWAFCGLGNPDAFYRTLKDLSAYVLGETTFNDHHAYHALDIQHVARLAHHAGAELLITTAKDVVKFTPPVGGVPIRWLQIDVAFPADAAPLADAIRGALSEGGDDERPVA